MPIMYKPNFAVLGGDIRYSYLADMLRADGFSAARACIGENSEPLAVLSDADTVIFPVVPVTPDGALSAPLSSKPQPFSPELCKALSKKRIFCGRPDTLAPLIGKSPSQLDDYSSDEGFLLKNARATAEGVMSLAVKYTDFTLYNCRCAVLGCGRIARYTALLLRAFGAHCTIFARKGSDIGWARSNGISGESLGALSQNAPHLRLIINTVPAKIISSEILSRLPEGCVILDAASAPGCTDEDSCRKFGVQYFIEPGLPGRFSPVSAAGIIKETVLSMLGY